MRSIQQHSHVLLHQITFLCRNASIHDLNYALIVPRFIRGIFITNNNRCPFYYMPDNSSLIRQLARRARLFHSNTGISQAQMAKKLGMADGNYSNFLSGKRGLGAKATCLLLQVMDLPMRQAIATFTKPALTSKITQFQEQGRAMRFDGNDDDGAWCPGLSGKDPGESAGNIDDPTNDTLDTLRYARAIHRKAISAINDYINQAKVNRLGSTPVPADPQKFGRRG
jgi:transcriptional regulator with XRE-family HTH domain